MAKRPSFIHLFAIASPSPEFVWYEECVLEDFLPVLKTETKQHALSSRLETVPTASDLILKRRMPLTEPPPVRREYLLLLAFRPALLVRRALAQCGFVEGAPFRFHPHAGVTGERGARTLGRADNTR